MNNPSKYVIKLTGSLFEPESFSSLRSIAEVAIDRRDDFKGVFVCGGGKTLRKWLTNLRENSNSMEYDLDYLGIEFTRINARILMLLLKPHVYPFIPTSIHEAILIAKNIDKHIVMGGVSPGFSTNAVAAFLAKELGYRLINITSAGGVYDKDPKLASDAQILDKIHIDDLIKMLSDRVEYAGSYPLFDLTSLNIIKKYSIKTYVIGPEKDQLVKLLNGESVGTEIIFD